MTVSEKAQTIGYIRVSTTEQNTARQLDGVPYDRLFTDKISGITKTENRPEFAKLVNYIREGDVVLVHSLDRLSRRLDYLISAVDQITEKGATIKFLKENLIFNPAGTDPMNKLIFHIFGALAEWQREGIKEAQREGIAKAKERGAYKGRVKALNPKQVKQLKLDAQNKIPKDKLCEDYNISIATLYRYLR